MEKSGAVLYGNNLAQHAGAMLRESVAMQNPWHAEGAAPAPVTDAVDAIQLFEVLQKMRAVALQDRIDINGSMRQACKNMSERNLGEMDKLKFAMTLAQTFGRLKLSRPVIDAICDAYPAGGADELGGSACVSWKLFVNDVAATMPAAAGQPSLADLRGLLQAMRRHAEVRQFDLANTFWAALSAGRERVLGFMAKTQFKSTLDTAFVGMALDPQLVEMICLVWHFGDYDPKMRGYLAVNWKKFCADLMRLKPVAHVSGPQPAAELGVNQLPAYLAQELRVLQPV